jgi:Ca2+-binding EF-hand superfamily protein
MVRRDRRPIHLRSIDAAELKVVLQSLGEYKDEAQLKKLIKEVDRDNNGTVEFSEFCWIAYQIRAGGNGAALFQKVYTLQKEMLSYEFSTADVAALKAQFATFDTSKDGRWV